MVGPSQSEDSLIVNSQYSRFRSLHPQVYASFIALTTVATNWIILALSTVLGGLGAADCDRSIGADGTVDQLAVVCAPDNLFALLGATTAVVVLSVAVFMLSIKRKHVGSFFKPRSYQQDVAEGFSQFPTRARVTLITTRDPVYWHDIEAVQDFIAAHRVGTGHHG